MPSLTEADTCRTYIVPKSRAAGWEDDTITERRVIPPGRIVPLGKKHTRQDPRRPDYILFLRKDYPIAVVEAKAEYKRPAAGMQQAIDYANILGLKFAYSSNGKDIVEYDFIPGKESTLNEFPSREELWQRLRGDLKLDENKLDEFSDPEEEMPAIGTTSQMLTTGVVAECVGSSVQRGIVDRPSPWPG